MSQISVRREALHLFGLREDELLPAYHQRWGAAYWAWCPSRTSCQPCGTGNGRTKVSADVIQLAAHEVDTAPEQAVSDGDASDSERSESASD